MQFRGPVAAVFAIALSTGCEGSRDAPADSRATASPETAITGTLTYRERIALPPGSTADVALMDPSIADTGAPAISSTTIELEHRQVPIDFELTVPAADVPASRRYSLRATISDADGNLLWITDTANMIDLGDPSVDAGTLILKRAGATGDTAAAQPPWIARGNEPGWRLTIDARNISLRYNYGEDELVLPRPQPTPSPTGRTYVAADGAHQLRVDVTERICRDDMTGMPHPEQVTVNIDGSTLSGCGGSPASLLTGAEWVVEDIGGKGIIDRSRATLNFGKDNRVAGRASCNTYGASWTLSGEGLTIDQGQSTLMSCSPALDDQEREFLRLLESVARFDITDDGALVLQAADGGILTARRE